MHGAHENIAAHQAQGEAKDTEEDELASANSLPALEHASLLQEAAACVVSPASASPLTPSQTEAVRTWCSLDRLAGSSQSLRQLHMHSHRAHR